MQICCRSRRLLSAWDQQRSSVHKCPGQKARKCRRERILRVHLPKKQRYVGGGMECGVARWARKEGGDEMERTGVSGLVVRARDSLRGEDRDAAEEQRWGQRVGSHLIQCFCARLRSLRWVRRKQQEDCDSRAGQTWIAVSRGYRSGMGGATSGAARRGGGRGEGEDVCLRLAEARCGGKRSWECGDRGPGWC